MMTQRGDGRSWDEQRAIAEEKRISVLNAMSLQEYFEQSDTPERNSPAGVLMERVLAKRPEITFEQARQEAHALLKLAAGKRKYAIPRVRSVEEQERDRVRLQAAFQQARKYRKTPGFGVSRRRGVKKTQAPGPRWLANRRLIESTKRERPIYIILPSYLPRHTGNPYTWQHLQFLHAR